MLQYFWVCYKLTLDKINSFLRIVMEHVTLTRRLQAETVMKEERSWIQNTLCKVELTVCESEGGRIHKRA
jgi:hypothetical protein